MLRHVSIQRSDAATSLVPAADNVEDDIIKHKDDLIRPQTGRARCSGGGLASALLPPRFHNVTSPLAAR